MFRFLSAAEYLRMRKGRGSGFVIRKYGLTCYRISECLCLGQEGQGIIPVEPGGDFRYILEESFNVRHGVENRLASILPAFGRCDPEPLDEAVPLFPIWGMNNFWHWTFECLPKLLALEEHGYQGPYIVNTGIPFIRESLELLGIDSGRLRDCGTAYFIRRAIVPASLEGLQLHRNMPLTGLLRERLLEGLGGASSGARHCYVRRIGSRKIINEEDLLHLLARYDFAVMTPEEHSLRDQLAFLREAECSLMAHGANTVLALMQPPGSIFMEMFGRWYVNFTNLHTIALLRLRYCPIPQELREFAADLERLQKNEDGLRDCPNLKDLEVSIPLARLMLESMLGSKSATS